MSDPILIVLNSGESLIGTPTNENDSGVTLVDIVTFAPSPNGQGAITVPYLPFSVEQEVNFKDEDIRHRLTPNSDLKSYYAEQFSKILTPADPKIVI